MNMTLPVGTSHVPTGSFWFRQFTLSDNTCTGTLSNTQLCENDVETASTYDCTRKLLECISEQWTVLQLTQLGKLHCF